MKTVQNQAKPVSKQTWRNKVTYVKKNWQLYLFFLMPGLLLTIIFKYLPMGGLLIAFEDYNVIKGVLGSPWVGLEYFRRFLSSPDFMNYLMNTLKLSIYGLLWGFPVPIILVSPITFFSSFTSCSRFSAIKKTYPGKRILS